MRLACSEEKRRAGSAMYDMSDEHYKLHSQLFCRAVCCTRIWWPFLTTRGVFVNYEHFGGLDVWEIFSSNLTISPDGQIVFFNNYLVSSHDFFRVKCIRCPPTYESPSTSKLHFWVHKLIMFEICHFGSQDLKVHS